jgi:hypothetical protein
VLLLACTTVPEKTLTAHDNVNARAMLFIKPVFETSLIFPKEFIRLFAILSTPYFFLDRSNQRNHVARQQVK